MVNLLWFFCALVALTCLLNLVARVACVRQTSSSFGPGPWLPNRWRAPLEDAEFVEFPAADGTKLRGSYLANTAWRRKGVVAFCHELNGDRWSALPYVEDLRRRGFDVLTFDFRSQGSSSRAPNYAPMPWVTAFEAADLTGAVDYLYSRHDADSAGIGLIGVSRGASTAIGVAAHDPRIRALVIDSACPTGRLRLLNVFNAIARCIPTPKCLLKILQPPVALFDAWVRMVLGRWRDCRFLNVDRSARQLRQPALIVHGQSDQLVPVAVARWLLAAVPGKANLWIVPGAGHGMAVDVDCREYQRRIGDFFSQHLHGDTRTDAPSKAVPESTAKGAGKLARQQIAVRSVAR